MNRKKAIINLEKYEQQLDICVVTVAFIRHKLVSIVVADAARCRSYRQDLYLFISFSEIVMLMMKCMGKLTQNILCK